MNMRDRKVISTYTDERLDADISRYSKSITNLTNRRKSHLVTLKISVNKKLQALLDEKQSRLLIAGNRVETPTGV